MPRLLPKTGSSPKVKAGVESAHLTAKEQAAEVAEGCFGRLLNASPLGDAVPDPDFLFEANWIINEAMDVLILINAHTLA